MPSSSRSLMMRSKIASQSLLRAKLSSVMKKRLTPLRPVHAQDLLDVVGRAVARLASLHVDDGAERALEGAAAAGVEARHVADGALDEVVRQEGRRGDVADARQVASCNCRAASASPRAASLQHLVEPLLGFAGEDARCRARAPALMSARRSPAAWRGSRRRGSRRSPPGCRPRAAAGRCRARGETGSIARRRCRPGRGRRCSAMRRDDLRRPHAGVGLVDGDDVDGTGPAPSTWRSAAPMARL